MNQHEPTRPTTANAPTTTMTTTHQGTVTWAGVKVGVAGPKLGFTGVGTVGGGSVMATGAVTEYDTVVVTTIGATVEVGARTSANPKAGFNSVTTLYERILQLQKLSLKQLRAKRKAESKI